MFQHSQDREATLPVTPGRDTELYQFFKGIDLSAGIDWSKDDQPLTPYYTVTEEELEGMKKYLLETRRDETSLEDHGHRISKEITYFQKAGVMPFLFNAWKLIERFRQDNIVWGVGRGSSCASYALFILGIHDINPIKYNIEFAEFSKETEQENG